MISRLSMTFTRFHFLLLLFLYLPATAVLAQDKDFPPRPNPPRLVNDLAGTMSADQIAKLEEKLVGYDRTTSTQITVVTIKNLGGYEVAQYATELANRWGIGQANKDNGVLIFASVEDRKINISTGYGLEGALTDVLSGRIIRNEIAPSFKSGNFYEGFDKGADAVIAATKGEYSAEPGQRHARGRGISVGGIFAMIAIIYFILWVLSKIGGGGGNYMSGRGRRGWRGGGMWGGPFIGGGGFGGGWGGGGSSGGGGFGGFGGGSFGGGGASGSW